MRLISQYRGLPTQIYILFMARTINSLGFFIFPFLTLFLSARIGMKENVIGTFLFVASAAYVPGMVIGGKLADHFSRKYTYVLATLAANILFFACGFLGASMMIPYLLVPAFFFNSIAFTASSAMMMDLTTPQNRQESYSLIYLGMNIGIAVGPLVAGILFEKYTHWIFWGDAISGFAAAVLVTLLIKDTIPTEEDYKEIERSGRHDEKAEDGTVMRVFLNKPKLLLFVLLCSVLSFVYAQTGFVLPLQLSEYFDVGAGARYFGLLMSVNGLVVVLATPIIVVLTKAFNPILNLGIAGVCYMFGFGMYAFAKDLVTFLLLAVIWTIGEVIAATNTNVYIANRTPISHRARLQAIYEIIQGTGRAIGPMLVGYFLIAHSIEQSWLLAGCLSFFATGAFMTLYLFENAPARRKELTKNGM